MGGHSQPRPRSADRHPRSAGRGATASAPASWTAGALSGRTAISCPAIPKVNRTRRNRHHHLVTAVITGLPTTLAESHCREVVESPLRGARPRARRAAWDVPCAARERAPDDTGVAAGHRPRVPGSALDLDEPRAADASVPDLAFEDRPRGVFRGRFEGVRGGWLTTR